MYGSGGIFYASSVVVRDDDDDDEEDEGCISDGFIVPNNVVEYVSDENINNESEYQFNNNNIKMKTQVKKKSTVERHQKECQDTRSYRGGKNGG